MAPEMQCNHRLLSVTQIENDKARKMWSAFAAAHGLDEADATTMYHGTSEANAMLIAKNGFRASCGERQMLGYGVYASTSFWGALRCVTSLASMAYLPLTLHIRFAVDTLQAFS